MSVNYNISLRVTLNAKQDNFIAFLLAFIWTFFIFNVKRVVKPITKTNKKLRYVFQHKHDFNICVILIFRHKLERFKQSLHKLESKENML